ncbi:MAG: nucleotide exchange factor GrpE [Deltaproteobacteria bacterium]|nr:nucleotide exchange factor GrpE [Deltaproteobacteria bacterium]
MHEDEARSAEADEREGGAPQGFRVNDRRFWTLDQGELDAEAAQPRAQAPSYVQQLEAQVAEKDQQLREYIAAYKQEVVQGLDETKRRLERDLAQRMRQLRGDLAGPLLEVLEALERSLFAADRTSDLGAVKEGVRMVHLLMLQKLRELGLERVETVGRPFDPAVHEAVAVAEVTDAAQHNVVLVELTPGFCLEGRVVRAAQVQVGRLA